MSLGRPTETGKWQDRVILVILLNLFSWVNLVNMMDLVDLVNLILVILVICMNLVTNTEQMSRIADELMQMLMLIALVQNLVT